MSYTTESRAKEAYNTWAHRVPGHHEPWERLDNRTVEAWREVIGYTDETAMCADHETPKLCPDCAERERELDAEIDRMLSAVGKGGAA